jgi:hypothetical protein
MDVYLYGYLVFDFTPLGHRNCSTCIGLKSTLSDRRELLHS